MARGKLVNGLTNWGARKIGYIYNIYFRCPSNTSLVIQKTHIYIKLTYRRGFNTNMRNRGFQESEINMTSPLRT